MRRLMCLLLLLCSIALHAQQYYLFIGTYTKGTSKGIYVYRFDASTGDAQPVSVTDTGTNLSYLALSPDGRFVYAANETGGKDPGKVIAYSFDSLSGKLGFIDERESGGDFPCYVSVDASDRWVAVANYGGGNLSAFPIGSDGSLGPSAQLIQHEGKGSNPQRQEKPHVHSTVFTPDQHFLLTPDLGLDKVFIYDFRPDDPTPLSGASTPFIVTRPGSGPRHIDFSPDHRYMYLIEELSGEVEVFGYSKSKFIPVQRIASVIKDTSADKGSADIHLSPDGKFLYASNRGITNNIAIYAVHTGSGKLKLLGFQDVLGAKPRNFAIEPSGHFLLVANQDSNNIVIFRRDPQTGMLTPTGNQIHIDSPVCLKWWPSQLRKQ
jgi:6-phosphogluconolactonase